MATILANGTKLDFEDRGRGDPVVLVHGDVGDRRSWVAVAPVLARSHRVLAYSRRHHWPNEAIRPGEGSLLDVHAADLVALLEEAGAAPAHLVGHSFGACVAMLVARDRPDLVRSLVLVEPPMLPLVMRVPPTPEDLERLAKDDPLLSRAVDELMARCLAPTIADFARGDVPSGIARFLAYHGERQAADPARLAQANDNGAVMAGALLVGHFSPFTERDARSIMAPTLLVTGSQSPPYLRRLAERLVALLPRAERIDLPGVGHFLPEEAPEAFGKAALGFLARR